MKSPLEIKYKKSSFEVLPEFISMTSIPGIFTIQRPVFGDERGDFWEIARIPDIEKVLERPFKILQLNRSRNAQKGILRGIHVANWDKLVTVVRGSVFIALVDLRKNSPTYGRMYTETIGDNYETKSVLIPAGCGNSYQTLEDDTDYFYAVTDLWSPGSEIGIQWNDPDLQIEWPVQPPILSEKDQKNLSIKELLPDFKI